MESLYSMSSRMQYYEDEDSCIDNEGDDESGIMNFFGRRMGRR